MERVCKHFNECGGCKFQDIPYKEQLSGKENRVREIAGKYGIEAQIRSINYYDELFYRGKMEFTFAYVNRVVCGLYSKKEKGKVVDVEECLIFSPDIEKVMKAVKGFVEKKEYSPYNKFSHKGYLRNLVVRKTKFRKELMVGIVVTSEQEFDREGFVKELLSLSLENEIKSMHLIINDSWSDAVVFEKKELLYGEPFIKEKLGDLQFNIGIDSFFQVNSSGVKDLYEKILKYAELAGNEKVLDLFCGVGSIGLFLAKQAKFIWGVEIKKEIIDAAWENAKLNDIANISFFVSDTRKFLNTQGMFYKDTDILIINPPRCGLSKKIIRGVLRLSPKTIFYSSCNPTSFFENLKELGENYKVNFIEPFDFFPHTPHLECLAYLSRI
jgi:23S rRNA (uracil-5-)-methyltransferase RumA